jgi:hypothetical protein
MRTQQDVRTYSNAQTQGCSSIVPVACGRKTHRQETALDAALSSTLAVAWVHHCTYRPSVAAESSTYQNGKLQKAHADSALLNRVCPTYQAAAMPAAVPSITWQICTPRSSRSAPIAGVCHPAFLTQHIAVVHVGAMACAASRMRLPLTALP